MANPEKTIGIDLGTTYCCVAVWQHGRPEVIANDQGNRTTPSMVAFTPNERLLGEGAKHQIATNPKNTVFDVKRLIGRRFEDETVKRDVQLWPFTVVSDDVGLPVIEVAFKGQTKRFAPQEISAMVLVKMKKIAEDFLNTEVHNAVITVPAYFSDSQRKATKDSATIAGLKVAQVINEPSAAAIAYGFRPEIHSSNVFKTILVFDLGGGTFDVSIVTLQSGKFEVKGVAGDMHLGGEDFDNNLLDYCVKQFMRKNRAASDITKNARALRRLRTECERAKRTLSAAVETVVDIDTLHEGYDFNQRITKAKFEELNEDLFAKCIEIVDKCIEDAGLTKDNIDEIVLVGGSSRIPKVQELVEAQFSGKQLCKTLNFDEAVAIGAALQGANLNNEGVELVLTDVVPLSLGISINGGVMNFVVPRNTPIPTEKERKYTTRFDNQTEVMFPLYEGERPFVSENNLLGEFSLTGIPRGPAGLPDIKVVFRVDANGILTVKAKDERSGVTSQIVIAKDSGRLTAPQIERMLKEADMFKKEDMEAVRRLTAKNSLETLINGMRTKMRGNSVKKRAAPSDLSKIREELDNAEMWIEENENLQVAEIERMVNALQEIYRPISF